MARTVEIEAMRRAIRLAADASPHPNPRVGAVILGPAGEVMGEGSHLGPGMPHAEAVALARAGGHTLSEATMVVTLEPCDHHGRTPPCSEAILASGIKRVVVAASDPDPKVAGRGLARLRSAGVDVEEGVLRDEAEEMDPAYFLHRRNRRAHFTLKQAITIDGQTAAADGTSRWITGEESRVDAHELRARSDAVMVGAGTLASDDPHLDVRLSGYEGPQPTPVVVAGTKPLPRDARLWHNPATVVVASHDLDVPVEVLAVAAGPDGLPDPRAVGIALGDAGLLDVLVEGGARLAAAWWEAGLVDRGVTYVGALVAGGVGVPALDRPWKTLADATPIDFLAVERLGKDLRIDWRPVREGLSGY